MKALVTGGFGFIGSHLAELLVREGYDVTCLGRNPEKRRWIEHLPVRSIIADLSDIRSLQRTIEHFDCVFHLAGLTRAARERDFFAANAVNTENLIRVICEKEHAGTRFIYVSSLAAAGPAFDGKPVHEGTAPRPVSSYGRSKLAGEEIVRKFSTVRHTIIRPPAVYGPRDRDFLFFFRVIQRGIYPFWGKCYYSLIYVEDLARGILAAARSRKGENSTYYLADATVHSNAEIARVISQALNKQPKRLRIPLTALKIIAAFGERINRHLILTRDKVKELSWTHWICDSGKAQVDLDFSADVSLSDGIGRTAEWYRSQHWL